MDEETQQVAVKLAKYVAEGGPEVEAIAAEHNRDNPAFRWVCFHISKRFCVISCVCYIYNLLRVHLQFLIWPPKPSPSLLQGESGAVSSVQGGPEFSGDSRGAGVGSPATGGPSSVSGPPAATTSAQPLCPQPNGVPAANPQNGGLAPTCQTKAEESLGVWRWQSGVTNSSQRHQTGGRRPRC